MKSNRNFHKIKVNKWVWEIKDMAYLQPWWNNFLSLKIEPEKQNDVRVVFRVESIKGNLFVKYDTPVNIKAKLKSFFTCKSESEFISAQLLESHRIPIVKYVGWGKCGSKSILISEEAKEYMNFKTFWFSMAYLDLSNLHKKKSLILKNLAKLVKQLLDANIYHPDFHIGNLLVHPEEYDFKIIDPYGVKRYPRGLSPTQKFLMIKIIGALRGEIDKKTASDFLIRTGQCNNIDESNHLWEKIVTFENNEIKKIWEKRKTKILSDSGKYLKKIILSDGSICRIRLSPAGETYFEKNEIFENTQLSLPSLIEYCKNAGYNIKKFPHTSARDIWLNAFLAEFQRKKQKEIPVIWIWSENKEKNGSILVLKNIRFP